MDQREFLQAQKAEAERLLAISSQHPFMGPSLRHRIESLDAEIARAPVVPARATTILYFNGPPVVGSYGIEVDFTSRVLLPFSEIIKTEYSARKHGHVARMGPVRDEHEAKLLVTGMPRGSFGFELSGPEPRDLFQGDLVASAMSRATNLVATAATSDEAFTEALSDSPARVLGPLKEFLAVIAAERASVRMVTGQTEISLPFERILEAQQRAIGSHETERNIAVEGTFRGATMNSLRFDFTSDEGQDISGKIGEEVEPNYVAEINTRFTDQKCVALMRRIELTARSGYSRTRYELVRLETLPPPQVLPE